VNFKRDLHVKVKGEILRCMFYVCEKCLSGCRTSVGDETAEIMGFEKDHRGNGHGMKKHGNGCGGKVRVVTDHQAGAGPHMNDPTAES